MDRDMGKWGRKEQDGGEDYPCPLQGVIQLLSRKWACQVIVVLGYKKSLRYTEIMDTIEGMNPSTLSNRLKELESAGLVDRQAYKEIPPRVEYSLTQDGEELRKLLHPIMQWAAERENI